MGKKKITNKRQTKVFRQDSQMRELNQEQQNKEKEDVYIEG